MFAEQTFCRLSRFFATVGILTFLAAPQLAEEAAAAPGRSAALKKVIEGAKKEGVLKIQWPAGRLGGDAGITKMLAAMNKRYGTNIKLQFIPGSTFGRILNKLTQEKAAARPSGSDILLASASYISRGLKSGMLRKLDWEAILERPAPSDANMNRVATQGAAVAIASRIVGISYNTNLVKGNDIPVSMEDVFKPKWKGKIASTPFATGLTQYAAKDMLGYERMKDYTTRLSKQIGGLFSCTAMERIASGEFAMLVFDCGHDDALRYQRRGAPVGQVPVKEIGRVNVIYFGVPEHAEHPNAAILFTNFLSTQEGQALQWELAGHDLHIYPEAKTREPVQKVIDSRVKLNLDTVQRYFKLRSEGVKNTRNEFSKILKQGSR